MGDEGEVAQEREEHRLFDGQVREEFDAEQQRARLAMQGLVAKVSEREQAGRTVYRVRVGPFGKKDDADRAKGRLEGNGFESALVRVQR